MVIYVIMKYHAGSWASAEYKTLQRYLNYELLNLTEKCFGNFKKQSFWKSLRVYKKLKDK